MIFFIQPQYNIFQNKVLYSSRIKSISTVFSPVQAMPYLYCSYSLSILNCICPVKEIWQTCDMLYADSYRLHLFINNLLTYLIIYLLIGLYILLSLPQLVFGLPLTFFPICIPLFKISRIAFIHHLVKQIRY